MVLSEVFSDDMGFTMNAPLGGQAAELEDLFADMFGSNADLSDKSFKFSIDGNRLNLYNNFLKSFENFYKNVDPNHPYAGKQNNATPDAYNEIANEVDKNK